MANITLKGNPIQTVGELPPVGSKAPEFVLTDGKLADRTLAEFRGRKKLLNIFPSLDTGVCAASARKFNEFAKSHPDAVVLMVSADLPFAQGRFCTAEGLSNIVPLSMMRSKKFGEDYGVLIRTGPLAGVNARAVVVIDGDDKVLYTELVPEIAREPDYEAAIAALR